MTVINKIIYKVMKKILFGLIAMAIFSYSESANAQISTEKKIVIRYEGGKLCWLGWSGCKGEIIIEWKQAPPKDVPVINVPKGYTLVSLTTSNFDKKDRELEGERVFSDKEVSNGKPITIPRQIAYYSKSLDQFFV